MTYCCHHH